MSSSTPSSTKAVAYARCSTLLGQDPELQLVQIRQVIQGRGMALTKEYVDHGISGAKERRPALDDLVRDARQGKFKVIYITALDRIARDTRHLLNLIHELEHLGVSIVSLREGIDFTSPIGKAALAILGAISTLEREITRDRIRNALAAKKLAAQQNGTNWRCGRPPLSEDIIAKVIQFRSEGLSIRGIERALDRKVSKASIGRILKEASDGKACPKKVR